MTTEEKAEITSPYIVMETSQYYRTKLSIGSKRTCNCPQNHLNCLSAKEWLKSQIGVWQFFYESRDVRDKNLHPATFPVALAKKIIVLFTHEGELKPQPYWGFDDLEHKAGTRLLNTFYVCRTIP
jgi:DNA modification methylase